MQRTNSYTLIVIVIILATVGQMASDIYLPSIPSIAVYFSTNIHNAELTVFYYTIGFSIGALIYGPLSDKFGRKILIITSLLLGSIGTLLCALAPSIELLFLGRVIQGLSLSCCTTLSKAILKDISSDAIQMAKLASIMGIIYALIIGLAPMIGGFIQQHWYWQMTFFIFLTFLLLLLILTSIKLPETNLQRHNVNIAKLLHGYIEIIKSKIFLSYNISSAMALGGLIGYLTAAPELLQTKIGASPQQFGYTALIIALSLIISGFLNHRLVQRRGIHFMLNLSAWIMIISAIVMLVFAIIGILNIYTILIPVFIFVIGCGITFSTASSGAINMFRNRAGTASSIYSCIQMLGGSLGSWLIVILPHNSQLSLGLVLMGCATICMFLAKMRN